MDVEKAIALVTPQASNSPIAATRNSNDDGWSVSFANGAMLEVRQRQIVAIRPWRRRRCQAARAAGRNRKQLDRNCARICRVMGPLIRLGPAPVSLGGVTVSSSDCSRL